jgi:hypothetical protein
MATSYTKTFNDVVSTTLEKYQPSIADNFFNEFVLLSALKNNGGYVEGSNGTKCVEPLLYASNSTAKAYSGYDLLDTSPQDNITSALYDWKNYDVSIVISGDEEEQNKGEAQVINLLNAKIKNAEMSLKNLVNGDMFAGNATDSKKVYGLAQIVEATGAVGGIDPASYTWWASYEENTSEALTLAKMDSAVVSLSRGSGMIYKPNIIITTPTLYSKYNGLLVTNQRFSNAKMAESGFENVLHLNIPVVYDEACTSGTVYFLNTNYLKLRYSASRNFATTPFVTPEGQDARIAHIRWRGAFTTNNRSALGKLTAKTA